MILEPQFDFTKNYSKIQKYQKQQKQASSICLVLLLFVFLVLPFLINFFPPNHNKISTKNTIENKQISEEDIGFIFKIYQDEIKKNKITIVTQNSS
jgi:hypothetical protein